MKVIEVEKVILNACPGFQLESVNYLDEGDSCWAYLVNNSWIFRFARHRDAVRSLGREYCLLPQLENQISLSIPSPQLTGLDNKDDTFFTAYPMLVGSPFSGEYYDSLDPVRRSHCIKQIETFLTQLHSVDVHPARACGVKELDFNAAFSDLLHRARPLIFPAISAEEQLFIETAVKSYSEECALGAFQPALLHGDLSCEHILCDRESGLITGIIDFGDMTIGDPAWDFVYFYRDLGLNFFTQLLEGHKGNDRSSLINRILNLEVFAALDLAVDSEKRSSEEFEKALLGIRELRASGEFRRSRLVSK